MVHLRRSHSVQVIYYCKVFRTVNTGNSVSKLVTFGKIFSTKAKRFTANILISDYNGCWNNAYCITGLKTHGKSYCFNGVHVPSLTAVKQVCLRLQPNGHNSFPSKSIP